MRIAFALLFAAAFGCFPATSRAQEADARIVDLAGTTTTADAPRKSAFGRVMDVMIATLIADHASQPDTRVHQGRARPTPATPAKTSAVAAPGIQISLGEGFELPPKDEIAVQTGGGG